VAQAGKSEAQAMSAKQGDRLVLVLNIGGAIEVQSLPLEWLEAQSQLSLRSVAEEMKARLEVREELRARLRPKREEGGEKVHEKREYDHSGRLRAVAFFK
jgi:hypothetical protein